MILSSAKQARLHTKIDKSLKHPRVCSKKLNVSINVQVWSLILSKSEHYRIFIFFHRASTNTFIFDTKTNGSGTQCPLWPLSNLNEARDKQNVQNITQSDKVCHIASMQPNRYKTVFPEQHMFISDVAMDEMFNQSQPVFYAICKLTRLLHTARLSPGDSI